MEPTNSKLRDSQEFFIRNISKPLNTKDLQMSTSIDFQDTKMGYKQVKKHKYKLCTRISTHNVVFHMKNLQLTQQSSHISIGMKEEEVKEPVFTQSIINDKKPVAKDKKFKYYRKDEYPMCASKNLSNNSIESPTKHGAYE